nr:spore coat protein U domain-containing protein [Novosphingobium taihuense]
MCMVPAFAHAASAQLTLGGTVSSACTIGGTSSTLSLGDVTGGKSGSVGSVTVTCNLADTGPTISLSSGNSGLKRDGGTDLIGYTISWPIAGTSSFNSVSAGTGSVSAQLAAVAPGTARSANLTLAVSAGATNGKVAGTYRDVITISISP